MVKMQFIGCAALHATSSIPLPDRELDGCRDDPATSRDRGSGIENVGVPFDSFKAELENRTSLNLLPPGVDKLKNSVI